MEKIERKGRFPLYIVIIALVVVAVAAVAIYYFTGGAREKEPSRGTYVISDTGGEYGL